MINYTLTSKSEIYNRVTSHKNVVIFTFWGSCIPVDNFVVEIIKMLNDVDFVTG